MTVKRTSVPALGWVGVRGYGERLWNKVRASPLCRVTSCYHPMPDVALEAGTRMAVTGFSNWNSFLASPIDAVVLIVPNPEHSRLGMQSLAAGKHLFVEKPLANTLAEAEALVETADVGRRVLAVGHNYRRMDFVREMKKRILRGDIGQIVMAEMNMSHGGAMSFTPQQWRYHRESCPGGPLNMLGSHLIDAANYLFGSPRKAWGKAERRFAPTTAEDSALIHVEYPNNVRVSITTLYNSVSTEFIHVYGTKGALRFSRWPVESFAFQPFDVNRAAAPFQPIARATVEDAVETFEDFIRAIQENRAPETGGREALDVVRVLSWILEKETTAA